MQRLFFLKNAFGICRKSTFQASLFFLVLSGSIFVQAMPDSVETPFFLDSLHTSYKNTELALKSTSLTAEQKSLQIDSFFEKVESACASNCSMLIQVLEKLNQSFSTGQQQNTLRLISEFLPTPASESIRLSPEEVSRYASRLQNYLSSDPEEFEYRVRAGLAALRALVGFHERALINYLSPNSQTSEQGRRAFAEDMRFFRKQVQALIEIRDVIQTYRKTDKIKPESMQRVVGHISDLGIFYIKLAQTLSNLTFVLPTEAADPLRVFQDQVEPMSAEKVVEVMSKELGRSPFEVFDFDPAKPLASGSIADTFEVSLKATRKKLIVKVQRPGLVDELKFNKRFNSFALRVLGASTKQKLSPIIDLLADQVMGLEKSFSEELDFRIEARNLKRFRRLFILTPYISIPRVYSEYSTQRMLTMTKLEGQNLQKAILAGERVDRYDPENDKVVQRMDKALSSDELQRRRAVEALFGSVWESFIYMAFIVGEAHADLHPGNTLAQALSNIEKRSNAVGLIDFAQTVKTRGLLSLPLRAALALGSGNAEKLASILAKMSRDGAYPPTKLLPTVQQIFKEQGIERRPLRTLWRRGSKKSKAEKYTEALGLILREAYTKLDYSASPRYVQIARSFAPTAATLVTLAEELPPRRIARVMLWGLARSMTLGGLRYLALSIPIKMAEGIDLLKARSNKAYKKREAAQPIRSCRSLFK